MLLRKDLLMAKPEKLMNFGAVLKKYRKNAGCTQQKLAEILGISKNTVTLWERNLARPDVETIRELNQMFGIPLNIGSQVFICRKKTD